MSGPNTFYFGSASPGEGIQQTVAVNYAANTDYNLTISVGTRIQDQFQSNLEMQILAGSTVIASQIASPGSPSTFVDHTLFHTATPANAALYG